MIPIMLMDQTSKIIDLVEDYEELIWTERPFEIGNFELNVAPTQENLSRFHIGSRLTHPESEQVYQVMTREVGRGKGIDATLKITGLPMHSILQRRVLAFINRRSRRRNGWVSSITRGLVAQCLLNENTGYADHANVAQDACPNLRVTTYTITPSSVTYLSFEDGIAWDIVRPLLKMANLRILSRHDFDNGGVNIALEAIDDIRTSPIIFAKDLENVADETIFETIENHANITYIDRGEGLTGSFYTGGPAPKTGWERSVLHVNAHGVDPENAHNEYVELAQYELSERKAFIGAEFDSEDLDISAYDSIGRKAILFTDGGFPKNFRIIEHTLVSNDSGVKRYVAVDEYD